MQSVANQLGITDDNVPTVILYRYGGDAPVWISPSDSAQLESRVRTFLGNSRWSIHPWCLLVLLLLKMGMTINDVTFLIVVWYIYINIYICTYVIVTVGLLTNKTLADTQCGFALPCETEGAVLTVLCCGAYILYTYIYACKINM